MALTPEHIEMEAELLITKEYGPDNEELTVDKLTEVFCVVYTYNKKGVKEPEEVFSFTTIFEQAMKRFKLLPNKKALVKRFLTDDEGLIKLAVDGTKPNVEMSDDLNTEECRVSIKEILDNFNPDEPTGIFCRELTDSEFNLLGDETHRVSSLFGSESKQITIFSDSVNERSIVTE